jgi:all-trans-8'-apo-beta-carotenal 15,15'-oxygenase
MILTSGILLWVAATQCITTHGFVSDLSVTIPSLKSPHYMNYGKPLAFESAADGSVEGGATAVAASGGGVVDFKAYANGYKTVFQELPFKKCEPSSGTIPQDLVGTYFRCGPAMFSAGSIMPPKTSIIQPRDGPPVPDGKNPKRMVQHPFEADGGVLAVTFQGSGGDDDDNAEESLSSSQDVTARFRYVRTNAFTNERKKGQRLYKAMDSTREVGPTAGGGMGNDLHTPLFRHHLQPGLNRNRKNTSNTRVVYWGKRLLSCWDGGQPYKLDALSLSTDGSSRLGGVLEEQGTMGCKLVYDPIKNRALMHAVTQSSRKSTVSIYEFNDEFRLVDEGGGKSVQDLPGFAMLSDMAATSNYAVFVQPAVSASVQFLMVKEPGKVLTVEKNPATIHLVPRVGSKKGAKSLTIPFDGVVEAELQMINAYEEGDKVILDAIRSDGTHKKAGGKASQWPWALSRDEYTNIASKTSLWRYTVDLKAGSVTKEKLSNLQCALGVINPKASTQKHKFLYMTLGGLGSDVAPPQGIGKFDCEKKSMDCWMPNEFEFCGEPMFAPKQGSSTAEDDGYILSTIFNGKTEQSELAIFQANSIASGPVARIPLGMAIPHGLHGCFTDSAEARWSADEIERRAKLADKMESRGNRWNEVKSDFSGLGLRFDDMEEYFGDSFLS